MQYVTYRGVVGFGERQVIFQSSVIFLFRMLPVISPNNKECLLTTRSLQRDNIKIYSLKKIALNIIWPHFLSVSKYQGNNKFNCMCA